MQSAPLDRDSLHLRGEYCSTHGRYGSLGSFPLSSLAPSPFQIPKRYSIILFPPLLFSKLALTRMQPYLFRARPAAVTNQTSALVRPFQPQHSSPPLPSMKAASQKASNRLTSSQHSTTATFSPMPYRERGLSPFSGSVLSRRSLIFQSFVYSVMSPSARVSYEQEGLKTLSP